MLRRQLSLTLTKTRAGHVHIGLGASGGLDLAWASSSLNKCLALEPDEDHVMRDVSVRPPG